MAAQCLREMLRCCRILTPIPQVAANVYWKCQTASVFKVAPVRGSLLSELPSTSDQRRQKSPEFEIEDV